jgi:hypothetical protein
MMIDNNENEVIFKKLIELYDYLSHNRDGLMPYKLKVNINMPPPPDGLEYRQLGTMEHNICDVLAHRMKGRKMSWSINGADNLSKILAEKFSNRLFSTLDKIYRNIIPNDVIETVIREMPLSAPAVNKKSNKSNEYKIHTAPIQYSVAAVSLDRKVIQKLCGLKEFGDISYN